jgi:hypothetical protein
VECAGDAGGFGYHTINIIPRPGPPTNPPADVWCLVEPQSGTTCCFPNSDLVDRPNGGTSCPSVDDVDLTRGPAKACMEKMCQGQYNPKECRIMSPDEQAGTMQSALAACQTKGSVVDCQSCCQTKGFELFDKIRSWCGAYDPNRPSDDRRDVVRAIAECVNTCRTPAPSPSPSPSASMGKVSIGGGRSVVLD